MAQIEKKEVKTPIQCSAAKFYEVYWKEAYLLPKISPCNVNKIELVDGTSSWEAKVGSRKLVHFNEGLNSDFVKEGETLIDIFNLFSLR
jgi:hypothetical protein